MAPPACAPDAAGHASPYRLARTPRLSAQTLPTVLAEWTVVLSCFRGTCAASVTARRARHSGQARIVIRFGGGDLFRRYAPEAGSGPDDGLGAGRGAGPS